MWLYRWGIRRDRWYPKSQIFTLAAPEYNAVAIRMSPADETHCPRQVVAVVVDGDNGNARGCRGVAGEAGNRGESFGGSRTEGCKAARGFVGYGYWGVKRITGITSLRWSDYN